MTGAAQAANVSSPNAIAGRLTDAITRRDFDELRRLLAPDAWLRALLPAEVVERRTATEVVEVVVGWFGAAEELEVDALEQGQATGNRVRIGWRARLRPDWEPDRWRVVEQVGFCKVVDGRVTRLDLVCTGFLPA